MRLPTCTYYQGIWEFTDFPSYLQEWIIPYMLKDVETVFAGARHHWNDMGCPQAGRGDFLLSTALFALFDHLGGFMGNVNDALSARENISRCARKLASVSNVHLIIGHFGRNALVHRAWPQTIAVMDQRSWAFGLNVTANPDESDHLSLYWRQYQLPDQDGNTMEIPVLKLRLNVEVLRRELKTLLTDDRFPATVQPEVFRRVRDISIRCCHEPFTNPGRWLKGEEMGETWKSAVEAQIREQYRRAEGCPKQAGT